MKISDVLLMIGLGPIVIGSLFGAGALIYRLILESPVIGSVSLILSVCIVSGLMTSLWDR